MRFSEHLDGNGPIIFKHALQNKARHCLQALGLKLSLGSEQRYLVGLWAEQFVVWQRRCNTD